MAARFFFLCMSNNLSDRAHGALSRTKYWRAVPPLRRGSSPRLSADQPTAKPDPNPHIPSLGSSAVSPACLAQCFPPASPGDLLFTTSNTPPDRAHGALPRIILAGRSTSPPRQQPSPAVRRPTHRRSDPCHRDHTANRPNPPRNAPPTIIICSPPRLLYSSACPKRRLQDVTCRAPF